MAVLEAMAYQSDTLMTAPLWQSEPSIEEMVDFLEQLELPAEDGIPMESNWHRSAMNLLIDSVHALWHDRNDYFVGGNMFIYFSLAQLNRKQYRGPDLFVVKQVDGSRDRDSWVVWKEDGRYPDVIVELASPSTINNDLTVKKDLYEHTFRTPDYFCYDPSDQTLQGWHLRNTAYVELTPNAQGWLWVEALDVWLGGWEGEFQRIHAVWPRLYTAEGQLVLTLAEADKQSAEMEKQRAETEKQRAERLAAKLRELGIDPESL